MAILMKFPRLGAPFDIITLTTSRKSERISAQNNAVNFPSLFLVTAKPVTAPEATREIREKSPIRLVGSELRYAAALKTSVSKK